MTLFVSLLCSNKDTTKSFVDSGQLSLIKLLVREIFKFHFSFTNRTEANA